MAITNDTKRVLRKMFKQSQAKELLPLWEKPRCIDYDGDYIEFGFIEGFENDTDEQVEEWFDHNVRIRYVDRGYDCTGQMFTYRIHWKRTPNNDVVSFVHHVARDW